MEVVNTTSTTDPLNMYNYMNSYILNPTIFIIIIIVVVSYYLFFSSLANNSGTSTEDTGNSSSINIMTIIIVSILIFLVLINAFQYFFSINIVAYVQGLFSDEPKIDIIVDQSTYKPVNVPKIKFKKQVFNIPGNYYDYENAKALCKAYGADLANYQQIEDAYKNDGEWCNYGWSEGQMALFPTQQKTFDNLQNKKGHEHDCGRPGVNGGYIANPKIKFGVNCYGNRPKINQEENELLNATTPYPQTKEEIDFQKRVDYWKNKVDQILVSPFNYNNWS